MALALRRYRQIETLDCYENQLGKIFVHQFEIGSAGLVSAFLRQGGWGWFFLVVVICSTHPNENGGRKAGG